MLNDYGQKWFHTIEQLETNRLFARTRNPDLESNDAGAGIFNDFKCQVNIVLRSACQLQKALEARWSPSPSTSPKQTGDQVAWTPRSKPKGSTLHSK
jgi:hypothetical protein